jgi:hypothetical protein
MSAGANDTASALGQLALGQQPITKREECQPTNRVPEDAVVKGEGSRGLRTGGTRAAAPQKMA